jgi:hypothetical protein
MDRLNQILLMLHFLRLTMGLSVPFANMVMAGLIAKASPAEKPVLGRFPPIMGRIGTTGLALLWVTGLSMLILKWGGFGNLGDMPWQFHVKLTLVVVLSALVGYIQVLERRFRKGDAAAMATIQTLGKFAFLTAVTIVIFAVLAFS